MKLEKLNKWICTDIDNQQYGRRLNKEQTRFEFKEKNRIYLNEGDWIQMIIDLDNYTSEEMKEVYMPYGFPKGELTNWIIAECIFEQESGQY